MHRWSGIVRRGRAECQRLWSRARLSVYQLHRGSTPSSSLQPAPVRDGASKRCALPVSDLTARSSRRPWRRCRTERRWRRRPPPARFGAPTAVARTRATRTLPTGVTRAHSSHCDVTYRRDAHSSHAKDSTRGVPWWAGQRATTRPRLSAPPGLGGRCSAVESGGAGRDVARRSGPGVLGIERSRVIISGALASPQRKELDDESEPNLSVL